VQAIKANTKYFYSYAKTNSKMKPRVGPLYDKKKNIFIDSSKEMADLLQQQYSSVFSHPDDVTDNIDISGKNPTEMCDISFTDEDIKEAIN